LSSFGFREHLGQQFRNHWKAVVPSIALILAAIGWFVNPIFKDYWEHRHDGFNKAVDNRISLELGKPDGVLKTLQNIQQTVNRTEVKLGTLEPFIHDA